MTDTQKLIIDQKDTEGVKATISISSATNHKDRDELIKYCESRLDSLNVGEALVEQTEVKQGEFFQ